MHHGRVRRCVWKMEHDCVPWVFLEFWSLWLAEWNQDLEVLGLPQELLRWGFLTWRRGNETGPRSVRPFSVAQRECCSRAGPPACFPPSSLGADAGGPGPEERGWGGRGYRRGQLALSWARAGRPGCAHGSSGAGACVCGQRDPATLSSEGPIMRAPQARTSEPPSGASALLAPPWASGILFDEERPAVANGDQSVEV